VLFLLGTSGLLYLDCTKGRKRRQALLSLGVEDLDALNWEQFAAGDVPEVNVLLHISEQSLGQNLCLGRLEALVL